MKLSPQEKAAHRETFQKMNPAAKLDYIFTYFKGPILLTLAAALVLGSILYRQITLKETVVYLGLINVTIGDNLETVLTTDYLESTGLNAQRHQVQTYSGLYLSENPMSENHQYAYASRMKLMASINSKQMDVALMSREAYNQMSASGYLLNLDVFLSESSPEVYNQLAPFLIENQVVLEDNSIDFDLNIAQEYSVITESIPNAIDVSLFPFIQEAGFSDSVYVGIIANSPRISADISYLEYLASLTKEISIPA